jgi:hypothetical protein
MGRTMIPRRALKLELNGRDLWDDTEQHSSAMYWKTARKEERREQRQDGRLLVNRFI